MAIVKPAYSLHLFLLLRGATREIVVGLFLQAAALCPDVRETDFTMSSQYLS